MNAPTTPDGAISLEEARQRKRRDARRAPGEDDEGPGGGGGGGSAGVEDPGPCPVVALGHRQGEYFYIAIGGEFRSLKQGEHKRLGILSLFAGSTQWLARRFPVYDQGGDVKPGAFSEQAASAYLFRLCHQQGLWDTATPQRGYGVWRDGGAEGGLLLHSGDALWIEGDWCPAGLVRDGVVYGAAPRAPRPELEEPADAAAGQALLQALAHWRYEDPLGPELVAGFIGAAMLGAAPAWRVHQLLVAPHGSGKSWLVDLVGAALGGGGIPSNDASAPGLQQRLTGEARTIILDEAETDEGGAQKIADVIKLLRLMAGGAGAQGLRGSAGGQSRSFSVTGCAFLAAILPPPLNPQDRSRITVVRLRPLDTGQAAAGQAETVRALIEATRQQSAALRGRAVLGWPRFQEAFARYRSAFLAAGASPRDADRLGTLLAGRDLLTAEHPPDADFAAEEAARFAELIADAAEQQEDGEGQQCLTHLYTSATDLWRSGDRDTVAEVILRSYEPLADNARQALGKIGLKILAYDDPAERCLLVAHQHVGLERIFDGTRWARGGWRQALLYLGGGAAGPTRFAGVLSRAVVVPPGDLPRRGDDEESRA